MRSRYTSRRFAIKSSAFGLAGIWASHSRRAYGFQNPNERPTIGVVGCGSRWDQRATIADGPHGLGKEFPKYGDIVAVCDVDANRVERARKLVKTWCKSEPDGTGDYRKIIDRDDIDIIHIVTPDHWHAKVAIEAMLSGKDVYCEKPMTLTIEEGRQICDVAKRTNRIMQIGTQRSDPQMVKAVALIRDGRLGKLTNATCAIGGVPRSPVLPIVDPPSHFDWNMWQGPVAETAFRLKHGAPNEVKAWSRCHYDFRWWYEYSGGKLTDWGAHHVDIATWGLDKTDTGPMTVEPIMVEHPVEFKDGFPTRDNVYNTATKFNIKSVFDDGVELVIRHDGDNGILFEGTEGRIFVNRGRLNGRPVEDLESNPLPDGAMEQVYKNRPLTDHVANFFNSAADRKEPISDVFSHHRALTTCHLAGIAARFNRKIQWDPTAESIVGDDQAQRLVDREKRHGFEIEM